MTKITTIIPVYNAEKYIRATLTAALAQCEVDQEIIVIDDGSTDDTWHIVQEFQSTVRAERQDNGGPARARNHGAKLATGNWLAFLDADDVWLPHKLSTQLKHTDEKTSLIYSDRYNIGHLERVCERQSDSVELFEGDVFEPLLLNNFITTSSVLIRKDRFFELGGFEEHPSLLGVEDWDLWLRHASEEHVALVREPLLNYRWHAGSLSSKFDHLSKARPEVLRRALKLPRGQRVDRTKIRQAFARAWACSAWFVAGVDRVKAFSCYVQSARYWPWDRTVYKGMLKCMLGMH